MFWDGSRGSLWGFGVRCWWDEVGTALPDPCPCPHGVLHVFPPFLEQGMAGMGMPGIIPNWWDGFGTSPKKNPSCTGGELGALREAPGVRQCGTGHTWLRGSWGPGDTVPVPCGDMAGICMVMGIGMAEAAHAESAPQSCWWPRSGPAREPKATTPTTLGGPQAGASPGSSQAGRGEETQ